VTSFNAERSSVRLSAFLCSFSRPLMLIALPLDPKGAAIMRTAASFSHVGQNVDIRKYSMLSPRGWTALPQTDKPHPDDISTFEDVEEALGLDAMSFMSEMLSEPKEREE
jgi:hypothetical protein